MKTTFLATVISALGCIGYADLELVMIEERGCYWCAQWNEEIAAIYPKSAEGQMAPLRRLDISEAGSADLAFESRPRYTPTFVLVSDGVEVSRIEGYPGEDFFWGLLGQMIDQAETQTLN